MEHVTEAGKPVQLSASGQAQAGPGVVTTIFVSSVTGAPTLKVWDNTAASGTVVVDTFVLVAGQTYVLNFEVKTGVYVTLTGTAAFTVGVRPY